MGIINDMIQGMKNRENGISKEVLDMDTTTKTIDSMRPELVMINDGVNICATACASCWDTPLPNGYSERSTYIGKRSKTGHTSILEHSNVVFYMFVPDSRNEDLIEFLDLKNYLHSCAKKSNKYNGWHLIVGGSWRGYSDLYLNCTSISNNSVLSAITNGVFQYIPSDAMLDLINAGIFRKEDFADLESSTIASTFSIDTNTRIDENINIVNCDDFYMLINKISEFCAEPWLFNSKDLMKFVTISIEFNNMSRIITQQLTRHRNGITQESQRYVDYSGAKFNSPALFRPDKYDPKRLYEFRFGGNTFKMNLQDIGNSINKIYGQLKDKMKYGNAALLSEDARGYLAQNTQCGKIFVTFTFYNLIKFLQLREDSHAQAEIRQYGEKIGEWFRMNVIDGGSVKDKEPLYYVLTPTMIAMAKEELNMFFRPIIDIPREENIDGMSEDISDEEYAKMYENSIIKADEAESNMSNE